MKKKKLTLARESIRQLTTDALQRGVAGGNSGAPYTCVGCEPSGVIACESARFSNCCPLA